MKKKDLSSLRREYMAPAFDETMVDPDPIVQFGEWFHQAIEGELPEVNAMTIATVSPQGQPSARVVLLKDYDNNGFVFYTNYESHKAEQLAVNPRAALVFFWAELYRQVRIEGYVQKVSDEESDAYFSSRPREAQLGAIASEQSREIPDRSYLDELYQCIEAKFRNSDPVRPPHWGGYRLLPNRIEFWQGRMNRLNDRLLYEKTDQGWNLKRLAP
jgi:pyridoxamine 5'-phosphate oxidase